MICVSNCVNILMHSWEFPPNGSGIGRYVAEMSRALAGQGHRVVVVTNRADGCPEEEVLGEGLLVLRKFNRSELRSNRVAELALEIAKQHQIDWIEVADHWGEGATILRHRKRPPVVVKMHYNDVLKVPRYAQAWYGWQNVMIDLACLRQWRSIGAERYSLTRADMLIAPCLRILDEAKRQGLPLPGKTAVVPNPIRIKKDWLNEEAEAPTLLLVGRIDVGKGVPYLKQIIRELIGEFPGLRVELAGGDNYARGLGSVKKWLIRYLGDLGRHVHFLGVLDERAMDEAYRRAWAVIVPSRWDTFPQVVLEAMARGKPIVASPNGGMPEMLTGTQNVVVDLESNDLAHELARLLRDASIRKLAGESGHERVRKYFAPDLIAGKYVATIQGLL